MGCLYSKRRKEALRKNLNVSSQTKLKYLPADTEENTINPDTNENNKPEFTERQKELVIDSWKIVQEDMARVGVQMFMK